MREDERDRVSRQGTEAWRRLKKEKNWNDWVKVGEALLVGREWAMTQAQTDRPEGKAYNLAFSEWLARYKLDDMDKGDRARLFQVMDALPQIEEWRRNLTLTERLKLNHPSTVLRKFKPGLRDSVAELSEENALLKAHIAELEAARAPVGPTLEDARAAYIRCFAANLRDIKAMDTEFEFLRAKLAEVELTVCQAVADVKKLRPGRLQSRQERR